MSHFYQIGLNLSIKEDTDWTIILRNAGAYHQVDRCYVARQLAYFSAAPLLRTLYALKKGKTLVLKYRILK